MVKRDVKPSYTAVNAEAARAALDELAGKWGSRYGAAIGLWQIKCLCLVTRSLDPAETGRTRWTMRKKPALNAVAITFTDRFPSTETS